MADGSYALYYVQVAWCLQPAHARVEGKNGLSARNEILNTNYDVGDIAGTVPNTEGNYTAATGLTGSTQTFSLQALNMGDANWRHRLYGFQVVEIIPEPATLGVFGLGVLVLAGRRRSSQPTA